MRLPRMRSGAMCDTRFLPAFVATLTAATAAGARCLGTSFVHVERSATEIFPVETVDGAVRLRIVRHFNEREAARLARIPIRYDTCAFHCSVGFKHGTKFNFASSEAEITNKNIFHFHFLSEVAGGRIGQDRTSGRTGRYERCLNRLGCQTTF